MMAISGRILRSAGTNLGLAVLAIAVLALGGCDSDPTVPQDQVTVTTDDAAGQTGYLVWALARIGPQFLLDPAGGADISKRDPINLIFSGAITGSCDIHFANVAGTQTTWNQAASGHMFTAPTLPLQFRLFGSGSAALALAFDIEAEIDRAHGTANVHGTGTLASGHLATTFTLAAIKVALTGYPTDGTLTVVVGEHTAVVTFSGGETASCLVDGLTFSVNLITGEVAVPVR
jgi:hypothetical protein